MKRNHIIRKIQYRLLCFIIATLGVTSFAAEVEVADGFTLSQWAQVPNARQMALSTNGTLFVGSRALGKVHAVLPNGRVEVIARDLTMPSGLALRSNGDLYVAAVNTLYRLPQAQEQVITNNRQWQRLNDELPDASHHGWKFIDFDPVNGDLVVPVGAPCNVCLVYPESGQAPFGTILSLDVEALNRGQLKYEILAKGVRNSVGFAWHPESRELWFTDNGRDWMGDDVPPCEVNRISTRGEHFGFPFRHGRYKETEASILKQIPQNFTYTPPVIEIQAHSAPLGMDFYQGNIESLKGALLVAEHGSWNRSTPVGYRLSAYWLEGSRVIRHRVLVNWLVDGRKLGRPVDVQTLGDGSVLISDDAGGIIWQLQAQSSKSP
ncbi:MAG: PQQ-dependent sugar dehydrogenase [Gammaproteobacteria bacterium]|nr:PQQ-dependent sugar dehydrogenase [Gammaproteobacteria bacterium]